MHPRSRQGSALIIVLALLALVMMLTLAALAVSRGHVRRETLVARGMDADTFTRLPADIVMAQLKTATTQPGVLWASQPGMIRTFGNATPPGADRPNTLMHYRLYSAPVMNSPAFDAASEASSMKDWASQPLLYTDLNEPVVTTRDGKTQTVYPVADPAMLGIADGYALRSPAPGGTATQPLPLPVAWMYVLQNGQVVMPVSADDQSAHFETGVVTSLNPIVARIAFWTDDETCKLNLNTASEPRPWDVPCANTLTERGYAAQTPATAEFNADFTHPAFTSLSVVMKHFNGGHTGNVQWPVAEPADPLNADTGAWFNKHLACYQSLLPHGLLTPATFKQQRHFPSVEEFYFAPDRTRNGLAAGFIMKPEEPRQSRFLLTTRSSAPELNPFGQPKLTLWTLPQDIAQRTPEDIRINALSTLDSALPFTFQRASLWQSPAIPGSSQSMTADWSGVPRNRALFAWLQSLCGQPIPGFGASFDSKYGVRSRDQILTSMFDMLRWSTSTTTALPPGPGAASSHGLAQQSALPLVPVMDASAEAGTTRGYGRHAVITEVAIVFAFTDVERRDDGSPKDDIHPGFCDHATKLRAFMVVNPFVVASGSPVSPAWAIRIRALQHLYIGPGLGLLLPGGNVRNRCAFSSSLPLANGQAWGGGAGPYACFLSQFMQEDGTPKQIGQRTDTNRDFPFISSADVNLVGDLGRTGMPIRFSGGPVTVDVMDPSAPNGPSPQPNDSIHSVQVLFPATQDDGQPMQLPMPLLPVEDFKNGPRPVENRFTLVTDDNGLHMPLIQRGDIVCSMVLNPDGPTHGDARLLASRREWVFPADGSDTKVFVPHPNFAARNDALSQSQSLRDDRFATKAPYGPQDLASPASTALLPGVAFASNAVPAVPAGSRGALQIAAASDPGARPGDWDSGLGTFEDGPIISRASLLPMAALTRSDASNATAPGPMPFSPVNFGALLSGAYGDAQDATPRPWQTLLFCPNPAGRTTAADQPGLYNAQGHDHPGFASPPDHLWLEFFHQPVSQPWPMTSGFASEGKVNMNFQILPWTWLRRATAMHGALEGVRLTAIPTKALMAEGLSAKGKADGSPVADEYRYAINPDATLAAFEQRFDGGEVFRTASEICEMHLVPRRITGHAYDSVSYHPEDPESLQAADMQRWWNGSAADNTDAFEATGDNLRESPYAQLYSRLCTQSNLYRVHYRVQTLKPSRSMSSGTLDLRRTSLLNERRGSMLIERSFTPDSAPLDPATFSSAPSLHTRQCFTILSREVFAP